MNCLMDNSPSISLKWLVLGRSNGTYLWDIYRQPIVNPVPILLVYPFMQHYFITGLNIGRPPYERPFPALLHRTGQRLEA
jgi:hypothetical protein